MGLLVFDAKRKLRIGLFVCLFSVLAVYLQMQMDGLAGSTPLRLMTFLESSKFVLCSL